MTFPVRMYIDRPEGLLAYGPEHAALPLPWGLNTEGPIITYGSYFDVLKGLLSRDDYQFLRSALSQLLGRSVPLQEIQELTVMSRKHGAFYHVAQVRTRVAERHYSLAATSAVDPVRQALLDSEFVTLQELNKSIPLGYIPRVFALGVSSCGNAGGGQSTLKCFLGEWFEGYHEFHLSRQGGRDVPALKIWNGRSNEPFLDTLESRALYHQAALILTAYYDSVSSSQIIGWHHAAGDFIVRRSKAKLQLRLITVRGYFPLLTVGADPLDNWIPLVHFFLNMSLRMRLDRLDGTGELAWASADSLRGVTSGFLEGWEQQAARNPALPQRSEVVAVLRSFSVEEWLSFASLALLDSLGEADELEFMQARLEEHAISLIRALRA